MVVPLDGSEFAERAVPVASGLARQGPGGQLLLVTTRWDGDVTDPSDYLDRVAAGVPDVEVQTIVIQDRPAAEAIALVARSAPDRTVCMTSHGRGRLRWALLGSVAEEVVATASEPIVLVGRHCEAASPDGLQHLLMCVDGSTANPAVEPIAVEWATALDLDVQVAIVIHPLDTARPDALLDEIAGRFATAGLRARTSIIRSSYPAGALADLADAQDASLVAMSNHARTGAARFALGSVTIGVVALAGCPVLVARTT